MFQKKPIYIVGIVLFTLILAAELTAFLLLPSREMPVPGWDSAEGAAGPGFGQMPDAGGLPGNFTPPEQGVGLPEQGAAFPAGGPPEQGADFPAGGPPEQGGDTADREAASCGGLTDVLRGALWPVVIVCVLGDALCIYRLVRLSRKKAPGKKDTPGEEEDAPRRRDPVNTWLAVIAAVLAGAVFLSGLSSGDVGSGMTAQTATRQAEAEARDLVNYFSGSGTLSDGESQEIALPASVTVTSYTVQNGDYVQAGDVIARVDKNSVLNAIYEVQALIDQMDSELEAVRDDTLDKKIVSRADGRVKAIYVQEGDSIADCMYRSGAVLLISLGGSMTVEIESTEEVAVGQTLTVILSDGQEVEGKVQQARGGKITVTTTDDGPAHGDTVTVALSDGTVLGSGSLTVSSPLKVTGYWGTADRIRVRVEDKVSAGDTLITLKDTGDTARYSELLRQRTELSDLVSELNRIFRDGCVKADRSGIVSQIGNDAVYSPLSSDSEESASNLQAEDSMDHVGIVLLSDLTMEPETPPQGTAPSTGETVPPAEAPPSTQEPVPSDGVYAGKVTKVGYGLLSIRICDQDITGKTIADAVSMDEALFTTEKQYAPDSAVPVNLYYDGQLVPGSLNAIQAGDRVLLYVSGGALTQIDFSVGASTQNPGFGGSIQLPGGFGYPSAVEEDTEEAVYEVEKASLCAIIPSETMTIAVRVDELDILNLAVGQDASVTLDALPGQSFSGTVKRISPVGVSGDGGGTKYTVTMELPRMEQMLDGMNASVRIEVSRLESALTVPAAAVNEDGTRAYVYTAVDPGTGKPANPVDVVTGASDGTYIQILSGIQPGDVVYYSYADSVVYQSQS